MCAMHPLSRGGCEEEVLQRALSRLQRARPALRVALMRTTGIVCTPNKKSPKTTSGTSCSPSTSYVHIKRKVYYVH